MRVAITELQEEGLLETKSASAIEQRRQRLLNIYDSTKTDQELASELGVSIPTVQSDIRALRAVESSLALRQPPGKDKDPAVGERRQRVVSSYDGTKTDQEFTSELGVSIKTVRNDLQEDFRDGGDEARPHC